MQITEMKIEDIPKVTELAIQLGYQNTILAIQTTQSDSGKLRLKFWGNLSISLCN
jgi:hypothetical protein